MGEKHNIQPKHVAKDQPRISQDGAQQQLQFSDLHLGKTSDAATATGRTEGEPVRLASDAGARDASAGPFDRLQTLLSNASPEVRKMFLASLEEQGMGIKLSAAAEQQVFMLRTGGIAAALDHPDEIV